MFLFVFFFFFFAFRAFSFFALAVFEFADFHLNFVAFDTHSNGQFGMAAFYFGGRIQDLIRVAGSQHHVDSVAFRLSFQTRFLAAFERAFEIFASVGGLAFQSGDVAISGAVGGFVFDLATFGEGERLPGLALAAAAAFRRRRRRGGVLRVGALGVRTILSNGQLGIIGLLTGGAAALILARRRTRGSAALSRRTGVLTLRRRTGAGHLFREDEAAGSFVAAI